MFGLKACVLCPNENLCRHKHSYTAPLQDRWLPGCFNVTCTICRGRLVLQKYYHGESIAVNVLADNNTSKTIKKIRISGQWPTFLLYIWYAFVVCNLL